ncbi:MAG: GAF domain-containing protein, partial [Myxococcales bacterium]|nr:GAF domain-containing protein [Myxococcales bacterium]
MGGLLDLVTDGAAWRRFRHGLALPTSLGAVRTRWERARTAGADPDRADERVITGRELRERTDRVEPLLHAAPDVLDAAAAAFAERDFSLLLADADGVVVRALAGGGFAEEASRVRLIAGAEWSESIRGTNAIGTALVEGGPVAVRGAAHWARTNHALACWATPLRDPLGRVVGVLDATSFHTGLDPVVPVTLMATARAIESVLRATSGVSASQELLRRVLEAHPGPALVVERGNRIRAANTRAAASLGTTDPRSCLGMDWAAVSSRLGRRQLLEVGPWAGCRASFEPAATWQGEVVAALVMLAPAPSGARLGDRRG